MRQKTPFDKSDLFFLHKKELLYGVEWCTVKVLIFSGALEDRDFHS
jgi:hypothetical protein